MKVFCAAALTLSIMSIVPASLYAKGDMVRITIKGANLTAPIEITDAAIKKFTPWAGPGVTINEVKQTQGFIIDWLHGAVAERPNGLQHYDLFFYAKLHGQPEDAKEELVHVVSYDYDPLTEQGYVYLPGKADGWYLLNASKMLHDGLEGNWFRANRAWEDFVRPYLTNAKGPAKP
jgi:hypothetical protein